MGNPKYWIRCVLLFALLLAKSEHSWSQMDLLWYARPEIQSPVGANLVCTVNKLKNGDIDITGYLSGSFLFGSPGSTIQFGSSTFWARYDSMYNLKFVKPYNYSTGTGNILSAQSDTNSNFYCFLYSASGNWKFDSLSTNIYNLATWDEIFIVYDSLGNYINHQLIVGYPLKFCIDRKQRFVTYTNDPLDSVIHILVYSPLFQQLESTYNVTSGIGAQDRLCFSNITPTKDYGYFIIGGVDGTGSFDLDPTPAQHFRNFASIANESQIFMVTYDSVMHVKNSIVFNSSIDCYPYYFGDYIYVVGAYAGQKYLVPGLSNSLLSAAYDQFIACFDKDLNLKWIKEMAVGSFGTNKIDPVRTRGEQVDFNTPPVFSVYTPSAITNHNFNLDFSKYSGQIVFQVDTNGNAYYLGSTSYVAGMDLGISTMLDENELFAHSQFNVASTNISFNEVPDFKYNALLNLDGGSHWGLYRFKPIPNHSIEGKLIADLDNSQTIDSTDAVIPFRPVMNVIDSSYTLSDKDGKYVLPADTGLYIVKATAISNYFYPFPANYTANLPDSVMIDSGKNFVFVPENTICDLKADIDVPSTIRPQNTTPVYLTITNTGIQTTQAHCKFTCDTNAWSFVSSTFNPSFNSLDSITWDFLSIKPFETITIDLNLLFDSTITLGTIIGFNFSVDQSPNVDYTISDNFASTAAIFQTSFDPNEKRSNYPEYVDISQVDSSFYFKYTIHFQNTGTAPANRVILIDTLDSKLDLLSLSDFYSSHSFKVSLLYNKLLKVEFNSINLPDSGADYEGSQGVFSYKVKPKLPVYLNERIVNRASIFFDFNEPVLTNSTPTEFVNNVGINEWSEMRDFIVYPNPASEYIVLVFKNGSKMSSARTRYFITDEMGRVVLTGTYASESDKKIQINSIQKGMYFVSVVDEKGNKSTVKFIKF